jgi:glycosyltransferase involved in cell wall biosynthesis
LDRYDLAHVLFERGAYRLVPELLARTPMPVVYGKGYDMGGRYRVNEGFRWQPDESMLAACDGMTFTTPHLAIGYDLPGGRATILGKAADVARFQAIPDPSPTAPPRIVCVAHLHARRRLGDLVRAVAIVRQQIPGVELHLVGGGDAAEGERLRALAVNTGVAGAVTFTGMLEDVAPEIADARVMALPSSCEGVPTALLEGMAAGRPVVATSVGHVSSIVAHGVEGFLVPPGDVTVLGDRLTQLLLDGALAARMGKAARARSKDHDVRTVSTRLLDALRGTVTHGS